jgi:uncharacterized membrane protein YcaP (DUF421 family)
MVMDAFRHDLTLTFPMAAAVVVTTAVMYLLLVLLLRAWGPRLFASTSPRAWATVTLLGAIVGRASLSVEPTLEGGVLALGTVLVVMLLLQSVRRAGHGPDPSAHALVVNGELQPDALARHHLSERELWIRLRATGRASLADVALVVLEPTGQLSVIPRGATIDPRAVADVSPLPGPAMG